MSDEAKPVSHYELKTLLRRDGFGSVYLANDTRDEKQYLLRVIELDHATLTRITGYKRAHSQRDHPLIEQIRQRMKLISELRNPHILPVLEFGEEHIQGNNDIIFYMVSPREKESLLSYWSAHTSNIEFLALEIVADLLTQAAEGLRYIHRRGLVHQYIRLSSFMLRSSRRGNKGPHILLTDFWFADITPALLEAGQVAQDLAVYLAPEQLAGKPVAASDQYGLAILTYELLLGHRLSQVDLSSGLYEQELRRRYSDISQSDLEIAHQIDLILLRALSSEASQRYGNIEEFALAFHAVASRGLAITRTLLVDGAGLLENVAPVVEAVVVEEARITPESQIQETTITSSDSVANDMLAVAEAQEESQAEYYRGDRTLHKTILTSEGMEEQTVSNLADMDATMTYAQASLADESTVAFETLADTQVHEDADATIKMPRINLAAQQQMAASNELSVEAQEVSVGRTVNQETEEFVDEEEVVVSERLIKHHEPELETVTLAAEDIAAEELVPGRTVNQETEEYVDEEESIVSERLIKRDQPALEAASFAAEATASAIGEEAEVGRTVNQETEEFVDEEESIVSERLIKRHQPALEAASFAAEEVAAEELVPGRVVNQETEEYVDEEESIVSELLIKRQQPELEAASFAAEEVAAEELLPSRTVNQETEEYIDEEDVIVSERLIKRHQPELEAASFAAEEVASEVGEEATVGRTVNSETEEYVDEEDVVVSERLIKRQQPELEAASFAAEEVATEEPVPGRTVNSETEEYVDEEDVVVSERLIKRHQPALEAASFAAEEVAAEELLPSRTVNQETEEYVDEEDVIVSERLIKRDQPALEAASFAAEATASELGEEAEVGRAVNSETEEYVDEEDVVVSERLIKRQQPELEAASFAAEASLAEVGEEAEVGRTVNSETEEYVDEEDLVVSERLIKHHQPELEEASFAAEATASELGEEAAVGRTVNQETEEYVDEEDVVVSERLIKRQQPALEAARFAAEEVAAEELLPSRTVNQETEEFVDEEDVIVSERLIKRQQPELEAASFAAEATLAEVGEEAAVGRTVNSETEEFVEEEDVIVSERLIKHHKPEIPADEIAGGRTMNSETEEFVEEEDVIVSERVLRRKPEGRELEAVTLANEDLGIEEVDEEEDEDTSIAAAGLAGGLLAGGLLAGGLLAGRGSDGEDLASANLSAEGTGSDFGGEDLAPGTLGAEGTGSDFTLPQANAGGVPTAGEALSNEETLPLSGVETGGAGANVGSESFSDESTETEEQHSGGLAGGLLAGGLIGGLAGLGAAELLSEHQGGNAAGSAGSADTAGGTTGAGTAGASNAATGTGLDTTIAAATGTAGLANTSAGTTGAGLAGAGESTATNSSVEEGEESSTSTTTSTHSGLGAAALGAGLGFAAGAALSNQSGAGGAGIVDNSGASTGAGNAAGMTGTGADTSAGEIAGTGAIGAGSAGAGQASGSELTEGELEAVTLSDEAATVDSTLLAGLLAESEAEGTGGAGVLAGGAAGVGAAGAGALASESTGATGAEAAGAGEQAGESTEAAGAGLLAGGVAGAAGAGLLASQSAGAAGAGAAGTGTGAAGGAASGTAGAGVLAGAGAAGVAGAGAASASGASAAGLSSIAGGSGGAGAGGVAGRGKQPQRRRRWLIAAILLPFLLIFCGVCSWVSYANVLPNQSNANITLTLASQTVQSTYAVTAMTSLTQTTTTSMDQNQVAAHMLTLNLSQTGSAQATGSYAGTQSTGFITFTNSSTGCGCPVIIPAGTAFTASNGVTVVTDTVASVASQCEVTVNAHVLGYGPAFVPVGGVNVAYNSVVRAYNRFEFNGGQPGASNSVVQQSDIDSAAASLKAKVEKDLLAKLQGQVKTTEQVLGKPTCNAQTTSDHNAGDVADGVSVTVSETCNLQVYDYESALHIVQTKMEHEAKTFSAQFVLLGSLQTQVVSTTLDPQSGQIVVVINASGKWGTQLSSVQKQAIKDSISGKDINTARSILKNYPGVVKYNLTVSGLVNNKLPSDSSRITINVTA